MQTRTYHPAGWKDPNPARKPEVPQTLVDVLESLFSSSPEFSPTDTYADVMFKSGQASVVRTVKNWFAQQRPPTS